MYAVKYTAYQSTAVPFRSFLQGAVTDISDSHLIMVQWHCKINLLL